MATTSENVTRDSKQYAEVLAEVFLDTVRRAEADVAESEMSKQDITPSLLECLQYVYLHGPSHIGEIARGLEITLPAGSQLVDKLVKRELATRRESNTDRRTIAVELTAAGRAAVRAFRKQKSEWFASVIESLSRDEMQAFVDGLEGFLGAALEDDESVDHACVRCGMKSVPFCIVKRIKDQRSNAR